MGYCIHCALNRRSYMSDLTCIIELVELTELRKKMKVGLAEHFIGYSE